MQNPRFTTEEISPYLGRVVTITTERVDPFSKESWLGDIVGKLVNIDVKTITVQDRSGTMGGPSQSVAAISLVRGIRFARPSDRAGVHNDAK